MPPGRLRKTGPPCLVVLAAAAVLLIPAGMLALGTSATLSPNAAFGKWTNVSSSAGTAPSPRQAFSMAFDAALSATILFGGQDTNGNALGDTWEFTHGQWSQLTTRKAPSARWGAGLVFDPNVNALILFGGRTGWYGVNPWQADTWEFTSQGWTQLQTSGQPEPQSARDLVWDGADGYVLLVGNNPRSPGVPSYWTFGSNTWTNITLKLATGLPSGVSWQSAVYDRRDGYVLFFGGGTPSCTGFGVTWAYVGGRFSNLTGSQKLTPTAAMGSGAMDYDAAAAGVLMTGGYTSSCRPTGETWLFHNGLWSNITRKVSGQIPGRWDARMVYDSSTNHDVTFGGNEARLGGYNYFIADTWTLRL